MRQLKITQQITNRIGDSVNRYFQEVSKYQLISPEEEVELTSRIKKGDQQALEKFTFVVSICSQLPLQATQPPLKIKMSGAPSLRPAPEN